MYKESWVYSVSTEGRAGTVNRNHVTIDFSQFIKEPLKKWHYTAKKQISWKSNGFRLRTVKEKSFGWRRNLDYTNS